MGNILLGMVLGVLVGLYLGNKDIRVKSQQTYYSVKSSVNDGVKPVHADTTKAH